MLTIPSRRYIRRFLAWVDRQPDGCWVWIGASRRGYGAAAFGSIKAAHRVSWVIFVGGIPKGADVLHQCDNRLCVNPAHLHLGDDRMNAQEKVARGRMRKPNWPILLGEVHHNAKFTEEEVRLIRRRYADRQGTLSSLAREFGTSHNNIRFIVTRKTWRHLD